jgi:hypothetical protein
MNLDNPNGPQGHTSLRPTSTVPRGYLTAPSSAASLSIDGGSEGVCQ